MHTPDPTTPSSKLLPTWLHVSDIQGLAQLATQATLGITGVAETVQGNVYKAVAAPFGQAGAKFIDRMPGSSGVRRLGITGLVYGSIKGVTKLAGGAANAALARAAPLTAHKASTPQREAMLSALNGVLGDQLQETANPLAISMSLRSEGRPLVMEPHALAAQLPAATGKVLVLIHGLCMNDLQWLGGKAGSPGHGEFLARELGYTPVYLHYNTGLHTSANGEQLANLLQQLSKAWPQPVQELTLLVHSMGGLVARSACHHAAEAGHSWLAQLKSLVFLGTPHHGAPLERLGSWVDGVLGSNIVTRPFAKIGQVRSAGITDLRHGNVLQSHWHGADRFKRAADAREPLPLPEGVACFTVAASTSAEPAGARASATFKASLADELWGDGLVPVHSALGLHADGSRSLVFAPQRQYTAWQTDHMALLTSANVQRCVRQWLAGEATIQD
ncbi:PGAP1-like protein [Polaromonas sp. YR568]|uniref:esterase/lipase family protein n=1 Tax=Polaromonas sp. YR568 TaxID=1855301 RepID=UPI0008E202AC|nr:permease [Polaromonas sp. YR568]SFU78639.1 PGAP1-like protein [Polaromonas sp. YR568]